MAKGARSAKSRQRPWLQLYHPSLLSWQGNSSLKTLTHVEANGVAHHLTGSRSFCGLYLNEVLTRVIPENDACEDIFLLYHQALEQLSANEDIEPVLRVWEKGMLQELGFLPSLTTDVNGEPIQASSQYTLHRDGGFVPVSEGDSRLIYDGDCLLSIDQNQYHCAAVRQTAKRLNRELLKPLLGTRPLKSRELFSVTRMGTAS